MNAPIYIAKQNPDLSIDLYLQSEAIGIDFNPVTVLTLQYQDVTISEIQPVLDAANATVFDLQARIVAIQSLSSSTPQV